MKKKQRKKQSAVVPILIGIIAILIVLVGIMGYIAFRQLSQPTVAAVVSSRAETAVVSANSSGYPAEYQIHFEQTWKMNKDFKGYLTLEGTALSTNVVQGTDNTFYREHGFDGGSETRVAFLDYRANIEDPTTQLLIYLPHADNDPKYAELVNFKNLEYYQQHPVINFNSLISNGKYKIYAVVLFPSGYEGIPYQSCMDTRDNGKLIEKALEHSLMEIPVDVHASDELLTVMSEDLSLMDENGKYARIVIFARKIRPGESEAVNTQKAVIKPNTYMPSSWYDQILRTQYTTYVYKEIRQEAANWFTPYELSNIADEDLERMMYARKAEYAKYLNEQEMLLSAEEKAYLYEKRVAEAQSPVLVLDTQFLTARVGDKVTLNVTRYPSDPTAAYTWTSSNDSVVSVTGNGASAKLTANKKGSATVTVTSGNASVSCNVEVKEKDKFILNPTNMTIFVDNSYNIKASGDIKQAVSSNPDVAKVTVNKNVATVYGLSTGETTITVTNYEGVSATCKVTVKKYQLTLDKTTLDMKPGNRRNIYVSTGAAANWYVDNTNVVKMSVVENGKAVLVEAVGPGTATVTATARNGAQAKCKITVNGKNVAFSTSYMDMKKGEFREMQVISGNVVKWDISDKSVAQVCIYGNGTTIEVEALDYGTATINAYGSDVSVATLTVNVSAPKESLTITPNSMTIKQGDLRNISVTSGSASNWVSSDPSVAEVYVIGDGTMAQVEGRKPGKATITVYDRYGGWVTCNVTVEAPVSKLVIGPGNICMNVGDWEDISVASGTAVDWASSDSNVVGVYVV
ncbi:MAG: Ig-like domain-containing protein, partial [Oscillospiraceae bacterium]|nr:Ig-like domain-containing protein [Oscillospiraceae bacterium]